MTAQIPIPLDQIRAFCQKHCVRSLALFGSVLRDDFRPDSDVDVTTFGAKASSKAQNSYMRTDEAYLLDMLIAGREAIDLSLA